MDWLQGQPSQQAWLLPRQATDLHAIANARASSAKTVMVQYSFWVLHAACLAPVPSLAQAWAWLELA